MENYQIVFEKFNFFVLDVDWHCVIRFEQRVWLAVDTLHNCSNQLDMEHIQPETWFMMEPVGKTLLLISFHVVVCR